MRSGIIEQRHGRACSAAARCGCPWSYRVDGPEMLNGRRRQIRKSGFATKTAAREALVDLQHRISNGEEVGGSVTVAAYLEDWMIAKATAGRRASTLAQYRIYVDNYLTPTLGHVRLSELRATHVDGLLAKMESENRGLPTRHRVLACLSSALTTAERRRLVSSNVCRQVEIAPERTPVRPIYDGPQLAKFLAHVADDRLAAIWRLYGVIGPRKGEALALTWSTVDLDGGTLRIERSLTIVNGRLTFGPPKSESGNRTVALDRTTVAIFRTHRARQNSEKLALGAGYQDQDLVFAREDGQPLRPEWVSKRFHALTEKCGLPRIHLHDLRHSAASMALTAGVPMKVVSENLGHSTLAVTANVYCHVTTELAKDSAERVEAALAANAM